MSAYKIISCALPKGTILKSALYEYCVEAPIGSGGFGITYKVRRLSNGAFFAMKEYFPTTLCERLTDNSVSYLKTNALTFDEGVTNFITEAKRLDRQSISHPNLISVNEVFKANNTAYYTMEYIDGVNLRQYILNQNKPLNVEQMLSVMRPVLQAVYLIHQHNLAHYDIKHENILLTTEKDDSLRPILIDFGQSKHYDKKGDATSTLTNAGCSDGFSPPEQYAGLPKFTPQADVYALCATMYYLLTAKEPTKSTEISYNTISDTLGTTIPPEIRATILKGMCKDKHNRIQSVTLLAQALGIEISPSPKNEEYVTRLLNPYIERRPLNIRLRPRYLYGLVLTFIIISALISVIWYNVPTESEKLTLALKQHDVPTLGYDASIDSSRAYMPYAVYMYENFNYSEARKYAEKALNSPDSIWAKKVLFLLDK